MKMPARHTEQPHPAKRRKVSLSKTPSGTKAALSKEFVDDSDDSDEPSTRPAQKVSTAKTPASAARRPSSNVKERIQALLRAVSAAASSDSSSEASNNNDSTGNENEDEDTQSTSAPVTSTPKVSQSSILKATTTPNGVNRSNGVKRGGLQSQNHNDTSIAGDGDSEGSEDSDGGDHGGESGAAGKKRSNILRRQNQVNGEYSAINIAPAAAQRAERPRSDFQPPSGFQAVESSPAPSEAAKLFSPSYLEGKEVWHITAPLQAPIDLIKEIAHGELNEGSLILTHDGREYVASPRSEENIESEQILIPKSTANEYIGLTTPIRKTLNIRQRLVLPTHFTYQSASQRASIDVSLEQDRQQNTQPDNLKMRFRPFGASSSDSDSEEAGSSLPQFRHPGSLARPPSPAKRKHDETQEIAEKAQGSPAKRKRSHAENSETPKKAGTLPQTLKNFSHVRSSTANLPQTSNHAEVSQVETPSGHSKQSKETPQERSQRKSEKRRRKDAEAASNTTPSRPDATKSAPDGKVVQTLDATDLTNRSSKKSSKKQSSKPHLLSKTGTPQPSRPSMGLAEFSADLTAQENRGGESKCVESSITSKSGKRQDKDQRVTI